MIIVKAPLRVSIGGGGTDLPSYYGRFGSTFISAAINKYIYISVHKVFSPEYIIKYSELERTGDLERIRHPLVRECLRAAGIAPDVEISSSADIPAGTGLGSSGTFTVALLKALYTLKNVAHTPMGLAEKACEIEIDRLASPVGKQDQYIAAVGGLTRFAIEPGGRVEASPLAMREHDRVDLEEHLLLFFTGYSRRAADILREQDDASRRAALAPGDPHAVDENLHFTGELGRRIGEALEAGRLAEFGRLMNEHWAHKLKRSASMSNPAINAWYDLAIANGALGGKLIGAGGGGFLMFLGEDKRRLRRVMREAGLTDVPFRFDQLGAQVVLRE